MYSFLGVTSEGLEEAARDEVLSLGAQEAFTRGSVVPFTGSLETGYRCCLWSRTLTRVLLEIGSFLARNEDELYDGMYAIAWEEHFSLQSTFAVAFTTARSTLTHTNFGALRSKDAIVDRFRDRLGDRPSVERHSPDFSIRVHVFENQATAYIDLSGDSLHRRHGRPGSIEAPLKEHVAAGILALAEWPEVWKQDGQLIDPMCGGGTFCIEAAFSAANVAPGLLRERFGFHAWTGHNRSLWRRLLGEARDSDRRSSPPEGPIRIIGYDDDPAAIETARQTASQLGLGPWTLFERRELSAVVPPEGNPGVVVVNPPYGVRLSTPDAVLGLYQRMGMTFKSRFPGWTIYVLAGSTELVGAIGLRPSGNLPLSNGRLECRLARFPILPPKEPQPSTPAPESLVNRLKKNLKRLKGWVQQTGVTCYRIYDADLLEYAVSIDRYEDWVQVKEYDRPDEIPPLIAEQRLHGAVLAVQEVLGVPPEAIFVKQRRRRKAFDQYSRLHTSEEMRIVHEGGLSFWVNPVDYLDNGLFLDHRPMRALVGQKAKGRQFLNLFCYTGAATVHAVAGGASSSLSVDLSGRYLDWAWNNLEANGLNGPPHRFLETDVLQWLPTCRERFDLIFVDPPTFSNSKEMRYDFDVQRDHARLLSHCLSVLAPGGEILFSNNFKRFKLDLQTLPELEVEDLSQASIPPDFSRTPRIHKAWKIQRKSA